MLCIHIYTHVYICIDKLSVELGICAHVSWIALSELLGLCFNDLEEERKEKKPPADKRNNLCMYCVHARAVFGCSGITRGSAVGSVEHGNMIV